jgi:hypothetical protein
MKKVPERYTKARTKKGEQGMKGLLVTLLLLCIIILLGWYIIILLQDSPAPPPEQLVWDTGFCRKEVGLRITNLRAQ